MTLKFSLVGLIVILSALFFQSGQIAYAGHEKSDTSSISDEEATNIRIYKNVNKAVVNIATISGVEILFSILSLARASAPA